MKNEELDKLWEDPAHWTWGVFYHCKQDPRLVIAKRQKWKGRTVNFARPMAVPLIIFSGAVAVLPFKIIKALGLMTPARRCLILLMVVGFLLWFWSYLAQRKTES